MSWDPEQYLKFADARRRPARDLLARLGGISPCSIVDLGCGAGNMTRCSPNAGLRAHHRHRQRPAMLAKAAATASTIAWQRADIATWRASHCARPDLLERCTALAGRSPASAPQN
jgi:trans-aconitate 2-methyltransferase